MVGIISAGKKMAYSVPARKETRFMVVGETASFLDANVSAGKTYHVKVTPYWGVFGTRFFLKAMAPGDPDLKKQVDGCDWVETLPSAQEAVAGDMESVKSKMAEYMPKWEQNNDRHSLTPSDGR